MTNLTHHNPQVLPAHSLAAIQLLELFRDPDRDIDRIVEFIDSDPVLTAETLRRSNTGLYRRMERTDDVFEAVRRLGFYELYNIVAGSIAQFPPAGDVLR